MSGKLYIGNVNENVRKSELRQEFEKFGEVSDLYVSSGYAFLSYSDSRDASAAIRHMDGELFFGSKLRVELAQEDRRPRGYSPSPHARRGGGYRGRGGGGPPPHRGYRGGGYRGSRGGGGGGGGRGGRDHYSDRRSPPPSSHYRDRSPPFSRSHHQSSSLPLSSSSSSSHHHHPLSPPQHHSSGRRSDDMYERRRPSPPPRYRSRSPVGGGGGGDYHRYSHEKQSQDVSEPQDSRKTFTNTKNKRKARMKAETLRIGSVYFHLFPLIALASTITPLSNTTKTATIETFIPPNTTDASSTHKQEEDPVLITTKTWIENRTKIATIKEDQLPFRNHDGVTIVAPSTKDSFDDDHYEDRDDYPPDWSVWAPSWSTPLTVEEMEDIDDENEEDEEDRRKLVIEEEEEGGIPNVEEIPTFKSDIGHWYVLYLEGGGSSSISSSTKRQELIDELKLNLASRLAVRYEDIRLNRLTSSESQLRANFTILINHDENVAHHLSDLLSKSVLTFSGKKLILVKVLKSEGENKANENFTSHIHPYSHTTNGDKKRQRQDEQVELMLYLTVGGLCIFLFVLALSFLALQLMKNGGRRGEDDDDDEEDWKLLLTAAGGDNRSLNQEGVRESSYFLGGRNVEGRPSETRCNECEYERQQSRSRFFQQQQQRYRSNFYDSLKNWTSKFFNSLRFSISGKYIDLNH